jgi:hypothetical protein
MEKEKYSPQARDGGHNIWGEVAAWGGYGGWRLWEREGEIVWSGCNFFLRPYLNPWP